MQHVQLIWAHPRNDSLTARVAEAVKTELTQRGWSVDELDLHRAGFDPVLQPVDEPDFSNPDKTYSAEVMRLSADLTGKAAAFIVFPVWWFSTPAILKGYIDRVWNHGIFYGGGRKLPFDSVRWIALAGEAEASFTKRGLDKSMTHTLNVGIAGFCGANDSQVEILYDTLGEDVKDLPAHHEVLIEQARRTAADWSEAHLAG
ncbi:MAG: NAD(P)H oxidoreductase [Ottowia sp.]|uniref:NAD(P)H oxidoreductase n=1 Tax=Ottowia sp. TaxID=1898956 RepID=UPI002AA93CFF|nr:NAD(P)H oxidoreductase [Alcaligenes faecalis]